MRKKQTYINAYSVICSAGTTKDFLANLYSNKRFIRKNDRFSEIKSFMLGSVEDVPTKSDFLDSMQGFYTRTNALLLANLLEIQQKVLILRQKYGKSRIGVVLGSTTSGVEENFQSFKEYALKDQFMGYKDSFNTLANPSEFCRAFFDLSGPCFGVSTACTSGLKAIEQASLLIENDLCDAVIAGGVDSLNTLSVFGFDSLGILDSNLCQPFSKNRNGINIGEGSGILLLSKEKDCVMFDSFCSNNDAYHITKQDSAAKMSIQCIQRVLETTQRDIDYVNLHATGTPANEIAESCAIAKSVGLVPASGIKGQIGHTLGAAGSIEAILCSMLLQQEESKLPLHIYDGEYDEDIEKINLVTDSISKRLNTILSVNFAFGGDNVAGIFRRVD